jgi:hypothetical protein
MIERIAMACLLFAAAGAANAQATCTRAELEAATAGYIEAQKSGDISRLQIASDATYLENMQPVARGEGLWNTALPIAHSMSFHDSKRCKKFSEIIVTEGGHPYVIGTRLYLDNGEITRIDSLVTD